MKGKEAECVFLEAFGTPLGFWGDVGQAGAAWGQQGKSDSG